MSIAYKISRFNRKRKWGIFLKEISPTPEMNILDVGFSDAEYSDTDNYIEKYYPYPDRLTALGIESPTQFTERYPQVNVVVFDGYKFPFNDNEFDVLWSNAVIEHVGGRDKQLQFLREAKRVAKKSFITTPNRFFPIEVHTRTPLLHYLPKAVFDRYLILIGKAWASGDYMNLLSHSEMKSLLADASIGDFKVYNNRLLGFILDYIYIF